MAQDWTPVVTAAIAGGSALAGAFGNGALQSRRERNARAEERREIRAAEIDAFEREQVQRLQDKLLALMKITSGLNDWRLQEFRVNSRWPDVREHADEYISARFEAIALAERMLVPAVNDAAWRVVKSAAKLMGADQDSAEVLEIDLSAGMGEAMKLLGERLAELYRRPR